MTPFATTLSDYIKAGYPAIAVTTHEEERLRRDLGTLKDIGWSFASWSSVRGWRDATPGATAPTAVLEIQKLPKKTVAVFFDLQAHFVIEPDTVRAIRDALEIAKSSFRPMRRRSRWPALARLRHRHRQQPGLALGAAAAPGPVRWPVVRRPPAELRAARGRSDPPRQAPPGRRRRRPRRAGRVSPRSPAHPTHPPRTLDGPQP
jgi:hypothetical protein